MNCMLCFWLLFSTLNMKPEERRMKGKHFVKSNYVGALSKILATSEKESMGFKILHDGAWFEKVFAQFLWTGALCFEV